MSEKQSNDSRRKLLKSIAVGSGAVVAGKSMPESWSKPVVNAVVLPAHAETTDGSGTLPGTTAAPACMRIEFQFPFGSNGTGTPITQVTFPANHDASAEPEKTESYVTAWGYFLNDPETPVWINTIVRWSSSNKDIAHTGNYINQSASSSVTTYDTAGQSVDITATYIDRTTGCEVSASYRVNVGPEENGSGS